MKQIVIVISMILISFTSLNGQIQLGIKGGWTGSKTLIFQDDTSMASPLLLNCSLQM